MTKHSKDKRPRKSAAASAPLSIHPRRPRLTDLGVKVPKDADGAYRFEKRIDGLTIPR